jgi:hypothetical protein
VLLGVPLLIAIGIEGAAGAHPLLQVPSHIAQDAATLKSGSLQIDRLHDGTLRVVAHMHAATAVPVPHSPGWSTCQPGTQAGQSPAVTAA